MGAFLFVSGVVFVVGFVLMTLNIIPGFYTRVNSEWVSYGKSKIVLALLKLACWSLLWPVSVPMFIMWSLTIWATNKMQNRLNKQP